MVKVTPGFLGAWALVLSLVACTSEKSSTGDYVPMKEDRIWFFRTDRGEERQITLKTSEFSDELWMAEFSQFYGGGQMTLIFERRASAILLHGIVAGHGALSLDPAIPFLPDQIGGGAWNATARIKDSKDPRDSVSVRGSAADETVIDAAGKKYSARRVDINLEFADGEAQWSLWCARGVGFVRYAAKAGSLTADWKLLRVQD